MSRNDLSYRQSPRGANISAARIVTLIVLSAIIFVLLIVRLFQLQVLGYDNYTAIAKEQHFGAIDLPARRGEILVKDTHSGELSKLATNTTLDLLYVDPMVAEDKDVISKDLAPLLFSREEYDGCLKTPDECLYEVIESQPASSYFATEILWDINPSVKKENPLILNEPQEFKSYDAMVQEVRDSIFKKISKEEVDFVILRRDADEDLMANIINERLAGIFVDTERFMIYADPTLIPESQFDETSKILASYLDEPVTGMKTNLTRRRVRYVFLRNRIKPEISQKIKDLSLKGVVLLPEHWRFYPEESMASNLVGFINREGMGQYGVEGYYNVELEGKKGTIYAETDPFGRQITVGEGKIVNAVDGDTVILTIDRIVQKKVDEILAEAVPLYKADGAQVIVMNPFTGAIIAMSNYPSFNPNSYTDSYTLRKFEPGDEIYTTMPVFKQDEKKHYVPIEDKDREDKTIQKFVYENRFGPGVFKNKVISEYYEPGSVFKPLVMSIALDAKEVEPQTTYVDDAPLHIDEFEIKNALGVYYGVQTMTEVLVKSLNTGMSFVAQLLGKELMYKYIKDFGFGDYTNIELEGETQGKLDYYKQWSKAQMLTTSFGQGIIATPLQVATAWCTLANGGKLIQPYIIDSTISNGVVTKTEPKVIHRVISEETSSIITSMLISVVHAHKQADIPGYMIAGKTGTAQIAGPSGKYEVGEGSTITSFAGYFPAFNPQFMILVKFDRPRIGENTWGETTASPTFRKIADFLIDYYNIQPDA